MVTTIQAVQVDHLLAGIHHASTGDLLAGGSVYAYAANTTTLKTIWADPFKNNQVSNPFTLDGGGKKLVFADGAYSFAYYDADGNLSHTDNNLQYNRFGAIQLPAGTVAAPSLTFTDDANNDLGLFWISEGVLGISVNGVLVAKFNADGVSATAFTTGV